MSKDIESVVSESESATVTLDKCTHETGGVVSSITSRIRSNNKQSLSDLIVNCVGRGDLVHVFKTIVRARFDDYPSSIPDEVIATTKGSPSYAANRSPDWIKLGHRYRGEKIPSARWIITDQKIAVLAGSFGDGEVLDEWLVAIEIDIDDIQRLHYGFYSLEEAGKGNTMGVQRHRIQIETGHEVLNIELSENEQRLFFEAASAVAESAGLIGPYNAEDNINELHPIIVTTGKPDFPISGSIPRDAVANPQQDFPKASSDGALLSSVPIGFEYDYTWESEPRGSDQILKDYGMYGREVTTPLNWIGVDLSDFEKQSESEEAHEEAIEREVPINIGDVHKFGVLETDRHHSGSKTAMGKVKDFVVFVETDVPESISEGDIIKAKIMSFSSDETAAKAKFIEEV